MATQPSAALAYATQEGGMGADQYYQNLSDFMMGKQAGQNGTRPGADAMLAEMNRLGVSAEDVNTAVARMNAATAKTRADTEALTPGTSASVKAQNDATAALNAKTAQQVAATNALNAQTQKTLDGLAAKNYGGATTLTPEIAKDLMYRSMTGGAPTAVFDQFGGYSAVKNLATANGADATDEWVNSYGAAASGGGGGGGANVASLQQQIAALQKQFADLNKSRTTSTSGSNTVGTSGTVDMTSSMPAASVGTATTQGVVYGPDGTMYSSPAAAAAAGVPNWTRTKPQAVQQANADAGLISNANDPTKVVGLPQGSGGGLINNAMGKQNSVTNNPFAVGSPFSTQNARVGLPKSVLGLS